MAVNGSQRNVLAALHELIEQHGYSPTLRELGAHCGLASVSTVHAHLAVLFDEGLVTDPTGGPRMVRVSPAGLDYLKGANHG